MFGEHGFSGKKTPSREGGTATTRPPGDRTAHVATTEFVQQEIESIVGAAPGLLESLKRAGEFARADVTTTTPSRAFGVPFRPSIDRPTFVNYCVEIDGGQHAYVYLMSDAESPPKSVRAVACGGGGQLTYVVPPGHYVKLVGASRDGDSKFSFLAQTEQTL